MAIKKNGSESRIKYDVLEKCGIIAERNGGWNLELRYMSWNDKEPKYDIRTWKTDEETGEERCNKGLTLSGEELEALGELIMKLAEEGGEEDE